jgi:pimeloyl-ACP methyl ester carboxylesterase
MFYKQLLVRAGCAGLLACAGESEPTERSIDLVDTPAPEDCIDGGSNYRQSGRFGFKTRSVGSVKLWLPDVPRGCKVPVIHLANGTGGTCSTYSAILQHLASHGFLTTCYESPNTGQGTQCIKALDTAYREYPELAADKIGSMGHSQGGGAAFMCVYRAEQKWGDAKQIAGLAMEPANGFGDAPSDYESYYAKIRSPMFMFNGSFDVLVSASWVRQGFEALPARTEAYWYEAKGAAHIPIPTRWTEESSAAWFRWKLQGDRDACAYFKRMPLSMDWALHKKQAEEDC